MRESPTPPTPPSSRPVLSSTSPHPTTVQMRNGDSRSERAPRNGSGIPVPFRRDGRVVQPPIKPLRAPQRKEDSSAPLHPALRRKILYDRLSVEEEPFADLEPMDEGRQPLANDARDTGAANGYVRVYDPYALRPQRTVSDGPAPPSPAVLAAVQSNGLSISAIAPTETSDAPLILPIPPAPDTAAPANANPQLRTIARTSRTERAETRAMIRGAKADTEVRARPDIQTIAIGALSLVVGIVTIALAASQNLLLQYPDARSHLEIARRVFDNRTPGLVQLGTVWLPVPHLLLLPFVNIDFLWTTGLAGSVVGVICLVITTVTLFLAVRHVTGRLLPAWLAAAVLLTNPSLLYMQTTALTEPVLLASMTASTLFLLRWMKDRQTKELLAAGIFAALAVGSRYDGWFFVIASAVAIALTVFIGRGRWAHVQGVALAYATVPCYAMGLWFLYNWIYFGDPLEFQRGAFSAQQQQKAFEVLGQLATKHDLLLSARAYFWAMENNTGAVIMALAAVGIIVYIAATRLHADSLIAYIFLAPIPFNILALWLGQTIIRVPQVWSGEYFNIRYGLLILPGMALFIAYLYHRLTLKGGNVFVMPIFALILIGQGVLWWAPTFPNNVPVVTEGVNAGAHDAYVIEAAHFLHDTYKGGGILIDDSTTHMMTLSKIPMREYVGTFSGPLWRAALTDPAPVAKWIVASNNKQDGVVDILLKTASENPYYFADYTKVYANNGLTIYERKPDANLAKP